MAIVGYRFPVGAIVNLSGSPTDYSQGSGVIESVVYIGGVSSYSLYAVRVGSEVKYLNQIGLALYHTEPEQAMVPIYGE